MWLLEFFITHFPPSFPGYPSWPLTSSAPCPPLRQPRPPSTWPWSLSTTRSGRASVYKTCPPPPWPSDASKKSRRLTSAARPLCPATCPPQTGHPTRHSPRAGTSTGGPRRTSPGSTSARRRSAITCPPSPGWSPLEDLWHGSERGQVEDTGRESRRRTGRTGPRRGHTSGSRTIRPLPLRPPRRTTTSVWSSRRFLRRRDSILEKLRKPRSWLVDRILV